MTGHGWWEWQEGKSLSLKSCIYIRHDGRKREAMVNKHLMAAMKDSGRLAVWAGRGQVGRSEPCWLTSTAFSSTCTNMAGKVYSFADTCSRSPAICTVMAQALLSLNLPLQWFPPTTFCLNCEGTWKGFSLFNNDALQLFLIFLKD